MRIALCQINTVAGNIAANRQTILAAISEAAAHRADIAVFPEMAITGYPPRDLLEYPDFLAEVDSATDEIDALCKKTGVMALVGRPSRNPFPGKKPLINSAVLVGSEMAQRPVVAKKLLPTYDVFDEHRYFEQAPADDASGLLAVRLKSGKVVRLGVTICEDIWNDSEFWKTEERLYPVDPVALLADLGAEVMINLSASPFTEHKPARRLEMVRHTARRWSRPVVLVNQVGGNDQVVFDGGSVAINSAGEVTGSAGHFSAGVAVVDVFHAAPLSNHQAAAGIDAIERALRLGLRDYLEKTGFQRVVVGNSGGIDSAVVLSLCALELGPDRVLSVSLPGPYTSDETRGDSRLLADNWGIRHIEFPITGAFDVLAPEMNGSHADFRSLFDSINKPAAKVANENLQSRLRGVVLMWLSNALCDVPTLLVTTGNKSELATGYCTLYGDMCGGLALISDLPKMMVYQLAHHINSQRAEVIPVSIIDREPTAELAPGQKDSDSLPPYPVLDEIVRLFVEEHRGPEAIAAAGVCDLALARRITTLIDRNEYKRQQAAPGIKVTSKAFGVGRRMPIARGR